MEKFPATFEPVMVVLENPSPAQLASLNTALHDLKGRTISSSPVPRLPRWFSIGQWPTPTRLPCAIGTPRLCNRSSVEAVAANGLSPALFEQTLTTLKNLKSQQEAFRSWQDYLAPTSPWWFLLDRMLAPQSGAAMAYLKVPKTTTPAQRVEIARRLNEAVPEAMVTGWSQALTSLVPWAQRELIAFGGAVALLILLILAFVYRDTRLWLVHAASLLAAGAGTIATLKLLQTPINLLNVLAFPLMLAVGVDYGTHIILAVREKGDALQNLAGVLKPIALSGLTTATGFGSLILAQNPALSGLGTICSIGVFWCLVASLVIVAPGAALLTRRKAT